MIAVATVVSVFADDDGVDTLRYYLSKSSLVVSGEMMADPRDRFISGLHGYTFRLKVTKVLKGAMTDKEIDVNLKRFQPLDEEQTPLCLKKGRRVILFLKEGDDPDFPDWWHGVDVWFDAQQYNSVMEESLQRLAKEKPAGAK